MSDPYIDAMNEEYLREKYEADGYSKSQADIARLQEQLSAANARADTAEAELMRIEQSLKDPNAVLVNMLRDSIAVPHCLREAFDNRSNPASAKRVADVVQAAVKWGNGGYLDERELMAAVEEYRKQSS